MSDAEEKNKALVRRFFEARARADLDAIEEMLAPDFISHGLPPGQQPDREGYKRQVANSVSAFSEVRFVIEEQVAAGEKVISRISGRATHNRKEIVGVAPTGREVTSMAIFIHRISEGKIAEEWGVGTAGSELMGQRLEQERIERSRSTNKSYRWPEASSKPPSPLRYLPSWAGRSLPTTDQQGRWEETSTTSSTSRRGGWELLWETPRARGCLLH